MGIFFIRVSLEAWWKVHPITIMVLLLLSSNIYGIIGMVVAIPVYSIGKKL